MQPQMTQMTQMECRMHDGTGPRGVKAAEGPGMQPQTCRPLGGWRKWNV